MMSNNVGQLWGIIIDKLPIRWKRNSQQRAFREALTRAYATWVPHHWEWMDYCFNEHFLTHQIAPRLVHCLEDTTWLDPAELANIWAEQFTWFDQEMRQRHVTKLIPAITNFLCCLEAELRARAKVQVNFEHSSSKIDTLLGERSCFS